MADEEVGKETNAGRFAVLHAAADALVDELELQFLAVRSQGLDIDPGLTRSGSIRMVRLTPTNSDGAPMTIEYSDFPGLGLRFGRCYATYLPLCGCDYCGDDPDALIDHLNFMVAATVSGQFQESYSGAEIRGSFKTPNQSSSGGSLLAPSRAATDIQQPEGGQWRPWVSSPRRAL